MGRPLSAPLWLLIALQALVSGASLVVEIVAGRMIAPYVGMSLYSWTAIIAVVLAGFSAGHWWGGRIAARPSAGALRHVGWTMAAAALTTAGAALVLRAVAGPVLDRIEHPFAAITLMTALVFFLPSLFAGVPSPVLAVVAMRGRAASERALGAMFAAGALGAIAGTLLAGFLFVSWLGSVATLAVIALVYAGVALLCFRLGGAARGETVGLAVALVAAVGLGARALALPPVCERESAYYCLRAVDLSADPADPVRLMVLDHLAHGISARSEPRRMFTDHAAMLDALPRMRMERPDFSSFFIGGGSYSVPRAWADRGMRAVTVAEIDPEVTRLAADAFWLDTAAVRVLHRDARVALARSPERYDVIVGDAFTDVAAPQHLVTVEFFRLVASRLNEGGVFAMNLVDSTARLDALAALVATLRAVFPSVEVWTVSRPPEAAERRVFVLLAGATDSPVGEVVAAAPEPRRFAALAPGFVDDILAAKRPRVLTDDLAPIDRLMGLDPVIDRPKGG